MHAIALSLLLLSAQSALAQYQPQMPTPEQISKSSSTARSVSLGESFRLALAQSETLAQQGETAASLAAKVDELAASLRPRFSLEGRQLWQDSSSRSVSTSNKLQGGANGYYVFFRGMRDLLAVRGARKQSEAAVLAYERAKQQLYQDVAQAYLNLVYIWKEIAIHYRQINITEQRIRELSDRERIGRSKTSEVLAAQSQLALFQAQQATAIGLENEYQWVFRFLTGLEEDVMPLDIPLPKMPPFEPFLALADKRPDVEQQRRGFEYSSIFTDIQRRQAWPEAGIDANYYRARASNASAYTAWDAAVALSVPLYTGGEIKARVAQAQAGEGYARLGLRLALRQAETDVRSAYDGLANAILQQAALEKAVAAAKANSRAQEADYRMGLVTNLDVLSGESAVQDARLKLENANVDAVMARIRLDIAAGRLPAD